MNITDVDIAPLIFESIAAKLMSSYALPFLMAFFISFSP